MMSEREKAASVRSAVLVLGMHRSGTSALSGVLASMGCMAPITQIKAGSQNLHGFFEAKPIARLNDRILEASGSSWYDWRPLDAYKPESPQGAEFREEAARLIGEEFAGADMIVLKDPRICRSVPVWIDALMKQHYRPLLLHTHRSPIEVAQSLRIRNGFPLEFSIILWMRYVLDAERLTRGMPRAFTSYDLILSDWRRVIMKLGHSFDVTFPMTSDAAGPAVDEFLSTDLRHFHASSESEEKNSFLLESARECFAIMQRWALSIEDSCDYKTLDRMHVALSNSSWTFVDIVDFSNAKTEKLEAALEAARARKIKLEARIAQELDKHLLAEKTLVDAQSSLTEVCVRNQMLDNDCNRQAQELGTLARLLRDSEKRYNKSVNERRKIEFQRAQEADKRILAEKTLVSLKHSLEEGLHQNRKLNERIRKLKKLGDQLRVTRQSRDEAESRYLAITDSSSWRLTRPLRYVISKLRAT